MRHPKNLPTFLVGAPTIPDCPPWLLFPPGLWSVTVSGRKHSIRLCSPRQAEAERWGVALREVIASKAPLETPTQLLLRDIQVREFSNMNQKACGHRHFLRSESSFPLSSDPLDL